MKTPMTITLDVELKVKLETFSKDSGFSQAETIHQALVEFFEKLEKPLE
jgi:predicted transcriptional regulator